MDTLKSFFKKDNGKKCTVLNLTDYRLYTSISYSQNWVTGTSAGTDNTGITIDKKESLSGLTAINPRSLKEWDISLISCDLLLSVAEKTKEGFNYLCEHHEISGKKLIILHMPGFKTKGKPEDIIWTSQESDERNLLKLLELYII